MNYLIGTFAMLALLFLCAAFFYDRGWKRGKSLSYEEGVRDGFREGRDSKEQGWWDQAEAEIDQERLKIWRESA